MQNKFLSNKMHVVVIHFDPNKYIDQNYETNLHDAKQPLSAN